MDAFVDLDSLETMLIFGVQGILIIFWVISPIGGFIMARAIRQRSTSVLILAGMILIFNVLFVDLTYLLTTEYEVTDDPALRIALATALIVSLLLGVFTLYLYRSEKSVLDQEMTNLINNETISSDFSPQKRRQERLQRRARRR